MSAPLPTVTALFALATPQAQEQFYPLLQGGSFSLESIQSFGHVSPSNFWYQQDQDEWVALLVGHATLQFEAGQLALQAGDAVSIPAQLRHRVAQVSDDAIWLALHFNANQSET